MPIIRRPEGIYKNFTVLDNANCNDERLSLEAKGLLWMLLSKPDHWVVNVNHLASVTSSGRKRILRILGELEEHGYLVATSQRKSNGDFGVYVRNVYDKSQIPVANEQLENEHFDGGPFGGSADGGSADGGSAKVLPIVRTELKQELNIERTEHSNNLPTFEKVRVMPETAVSQIQPFRAEFDELWEIYPRKHGRKRAYGQLVATLRRGVAISDLRLAVENYALIRQGEMQDFTLHASTFWGPNDRWEDYLTVVDNPRGHGSITSTKAFQAIQDFLDAGTS